MNRNVYRSEFGNRPFFAVISAGGIQFRAAQSYEKQMLDSYSNAFKYWLPEAVLAKSRPIAELTLIGEISATNRNTGQEYSVVIGNLTRMQGLRHSDARLHRCYFGRLEQQ